MGTELPNPHDRFFKKVFSREALARNFFRNCLSPDLVRLIDLKSAKLSKGSFSDKHLRMHFSDLLYKARLKQKAEPLYLYLLLEHKSYSERLTGFQLLRYMVRIWERIVRRHEEEKKKAEKEGKKKDRDKPFLLPPVLPIVICHGRSAWNIPPDFRSLFPDCPEFASCIPDFRYVTFDISARSDDEIRGTAVLRAAMLVMKYIFRDDLAQKLPEILSLLKETVTESSGLEFLETLMVYLSRGTDRLSEKELGEAVTSVFSETGGELMPTLAEKWKNEALFDVIEQFLELKFGKDGLDILPEIRKIQDTDLLKTIHRGLITKNSLNELRQIYQG